MNRELDMFYGTSLEPLYQAGAEVQEKYYTTYDDDGPRGTKRRKEIAANKKSRTTKKDK